MKVIEKSMVLSQRKDITDGKAYYALAWRVETADIISNWDEC